MLDLWSQKSSWRDAADGIARDLGAPGAKLAIVAPAGAGRHAIARQLERSHGYAVVELPPYRDLDAPLHGAAQLASQAGLTPPGRQPEELAAAAGAAFAAANRGLALLLPASPGRPTAEGDAPTRDAIERMVSALAAIDPLRLAIVAPVGTRLRERIARQVELPRIRVDASGLRPDLLPPRFANAARALAAAIARHAWEWTPLEVRLQVGLVALGERPDEVGQPLAALVHRLVRQLTRWPSLDAAVRRLVRARRPLPASAVASVSRVDDEWLPLLTDCIGYGDSEVRIPELTRQVLIDALAAPRAEVEAAHAELARHHAALDGAHHVHDLGADRTVHWLEKVHHLALGGDDCADAWAAQAPAGREQLWERARYLSREGRRYREAAALYQRCLDEFGDDAYSRHYLAYNLERAGGDLGAVRAGYAAAIRDDRKNPWWHQRWIRFLIAHGTLAEARAAWRQAIAAIDPTGDQLRSSPWLAENLHYAVARRWLELGRVEDAREVVDEIPMPWRRDREELRDLDRWIASCEQALRLGESVYPSSTPLAERWQAPRALPPRRAGHALVDWAPGRVIAASAAEVTVILAPTPDDAQQVTYDAQRWRLLTGDPAEDAGGYVEHGRYADGEEIVRVAPDRDEAPAISAGELVARVVA